MKIIVKSLPFSTYSYININKLLFRPELAKKDSFLIYLYYEYPNEQGFDACLCFGLVELLQWKASF